MMTLHGGEKEEDVVVVIASTIPPGKNFSYFGHEGYSCNKITMT